MHPVSYPEYPLLYVAKLILMASMLVHAYRAAVNTY